MSERELAHADLEPTDFPFVRRPPVFSARTTRAGLGWDSSEQADAIKLTVADHVGSDRTVTITVHPSEAGRRALESLTANA